MTSDAPITIRPLGKPGDLGWVVQAHGEQYFDEFGWDASFEALVARIVAEYTTLPPGGGAAWIGEGRDGQRLGCIFCVPLDDTTAQLRLLLVDAAGRGSGLGGRLVDTCIDHARRTGASVLRLWTNHPLVAARRIYESRGFVLIDETSHHSFGVDLIGQTFELDLAAPSRMS